MRVLIIEDEDLAADTLQSTLLEINPNIQVLAILGTVESAVAWLKKNKADLLFMDIHLGDGESFQIFQQVEVSSPVIFTTAYDQYTLKAFKNQGIDYLLKPFDEEDVRAALLKLSSIRKGSALNLPPVQQKPPEQTVALKIRNRFMVKLGKLIKTVGAEDVAYFMADDKYLFLVTHDKQNYIIEETIGSLEHQLDPAEFFRINRKFIVNITAIKEMYKLSRNRVRIVLSPAPPTGTEAVVSEERAEDFKQWLNQ
ncbi:two-component system response regulator [Pedobacter sp. BAL39]|uniref:LytR/AlgR family response regulator transcription factor n=1 Tax=Pedobacter sp. BAL39 TaxID=391596 RepID=UPI0001559502|nr:LytTR family DNA-binding domain-containing protein [Pedobacter sp. BAL39]EDM36887.1 two-component system response regulator [Pedobacter sp. BAL39]